MNDSIPPKSILLLAANPKGSVNLRLHEEERDIKERLRLAGYGKVPIYSTGATRPRDIHQAMLDFKPQIVHFSGHGAGEDGLVFEDATGQGKLVSSEALANLFRIFSNRVECVILNACYSRFQAEAISQHIDYVIGMSQAIGDRAAIEFAVGFYMAVGAGEPIDLAYELGCNAIQFEGVPGHLTPLLYKGGELVRSQPTNNNEQLDNKAKRGSTKSVSNHQDPHPPALKPDTRKFRFEYAQIELKPSGMLGFARKPEISLRRKEASYFIEDLGSGIELEIVALPSGNFLMGASDEEQISPSELPQHQVSIASFFMGKYAVTQMQWKAVARLPQIDRPLNDDPSKFKGDRHPVERVSWDDAVEFCKRLSQKTGRYYRLPSEAEWEYSCRAGTTALFHFGDVITSDVANYNASKDTGSLRGILRSQTTPVHNFKFANALGLYDMHGNVWEWCMDHWHGNYKRASNDGSARISNKDVHQRVIRGGSWSDLKGNCRSACRKPAPADERTEFLGFRVACS